MKKIGIIGGGASGALTALHCWKELGESCEISVFEQSADLGVGKAYSTQNTNYILNIPACDMHIYPDKSDSFEHWLLHLNPSLKDSKYWPFVPRFYFGQYLQEHLAKIPQKNLKHIQQKVLDIEVKNDTYSLKLENQSIYDCNYLVIATGFSKMSNTLPFHTEKTEFSQIYRTEDLKHCDTSKFSGHIVIVGTGLTAIDIWRQLKENSKVHFTLLSRHGFLPHSKLNSKKKIKLPNLSEMSPKQILQILKTIQHYGEIQWTEIADSLQSQAQQIWSCWTVKEKELFLKYLKPYWEIIRHQVPNSVFEEIEKDIHLKNTRIKSGKIQSISETSSGILLEYQDRKTRSLQTLHPDHLIFAIGPTIQQNLIQENKIAGIKKCPYGFGYINSTAPRIWCVGPATKGMYFEITSIPYIRTQAEMIAHEIASATMQTKSLKLERFYMHPKAAGETYFEHLKQAMSFSTKLSKYTWYTLVHAILPFLYVDKTSDCLRNLACTLSKRRQRTTHSQKNDVTEVSSLTHPSHLASSNHQNHQQTHY